MKFWAAMTTILERRKMKRDETPVREDLTKLTLRRNGSTSYLRKYFPKEESRQERCWQAGKESHEQFSWVEISFEENDFSTTSVSKSGEDFLQRDLSRAN